MCAIAGQALHASPGDEASLGFAAEQARRCLRNALFFGPRYSLHNSVF